MPMRRPSSPPHLARSAPSTADRPSTAAVHRAGGTNLPKHLPLNTPPSGACLGSGCGRPRGGPTRVVVIVARRQTSGKDSATRVSAVGARPRDLAQPGASGPKPRSWPAQPPRGRPRTDRPAPRGTRARRQPLQQLGQLPHLTDERQHHGLGVLELIPVTFGDEGARSVPDLDQVRHTGEYAAPPRLGGRAGLESQL